MTTSGGLESTRRPSQAVWILGRLYEGVLICVAVLCCLPFVDALDTHRPVSYSGHKVLRVLLRNEEQVKIVRALEPEGTSRRGVNILNELQADGFIDLHVTSDMHDDVIHTFLKSGIDYKIMVNDIQQLINEEHIEGDRHRRSRRSLLRTSEEKLRRGKHRRVNTTSDNGTPGRHQLRTSHADNIKRVLLRAELSGVISRYSTYDEIVDWLRLVQQYLPDVARLEMIGRSSEGRPLYMMKLGERRSTVKPAVWIDGGIHAREWISPAAAIYVIYALVTGYEADYAEIKMLLSEFDWYIVPVINPDGYVYSHTTDRLWRKTRSRNPASNISDCQGVDPNRNFDFQWKSECNAQLKCRGINACDHTFAGLRPFSEPETIAMSDWILTNKDRLKLYFTLHASSLLWLVPWAYTVAHPDDYDDLIRSSRRAVEAMEAMTAINQTKYRIGSPANILYAATGVSSDWAKGVAGVKYSIAIELRKYRDTGFLPPRSEIIPTSQEIWAGIRKMVLEVKSDDAWMAGGTQMRTLVQNTVSGGEPQDVNHSLEIKIKAIDVP